MHKPNTIDWVALVLVLVGALNWGLVGLLGLDLVALVFGDMSLISRIIYVLVGAAAVYVILAAPKMMKKPTA